MNINNIIFKYINLIINIFIFFKNSYNLGTVLTSIKIFYSSNQTKTISSTILTHLHTTQLY